MASTPTFFGKEPIINTSEIPNLFPASVEPIEREIEQIQSELLRIESARIALSNAPEADYETMRARHQQRMNLAAQALDLVQRNEVLQEVLRLRHVRQADPMPHNINR